MNININKKYLDLNEFFRFLFILILNFFIIFLFLDLIDKKKYLDFYFLFIKIIFNREVFRS
jgi:hypothetical protein